MLCERKRIKNVLINDEEYLYAMLLYMARWDTASLTRYRKQKCFYENCSVRRKTNGSEELGGTLPSLEELFAS